MTLLLTCSVLSQRRYDIGARIHRSCSVLVQRNNFRSRENVLIQQHTCCSATKKMACGSKSSSATIQSTGSCLVNGASVTVLDIGVEFTYTVPSFSVLQVDLRQATVQVELDNGTGVLYDCFLKAHPSLPARQCCIPLYLTIEKHCFVPVSPYN